MAVSSTPVRVFARGVRRNRSCLPLEQDAAGSGILCSPLCRSTVLHADTVPVGSGPLAWMRGAECREQRQYIRCHRRSLSPGLFVVGFAHCMYFRTLYGPVYQTPGSLRTVRESLLPLSALLSPLSLSHCSPCAPRCRCCFAACPGREKRACLRVLCLPAALLAGMAEDTWLVAGGIGFSAGRARSL